MSAVIKPKYLPEIEQGQNDYRSYRPLVLPTESGEDGITILLVNDPQSKHFAASVSVGSGASSDPRALPGLAHFCEHMCFLGSAAYPKENEYKQYLAQHGGKSNASTSMSHTTYQFDVLADHAEKALDIFSHFFISPSFTQSGTGREVHAVDSENSKNLVNDGRRRWQILKSLGDKDHHFTKFSTGNKFTLPVNTDLDDGDDNGVVGGETASDPHPLTGILQKMDSKYDERDMPEFVRAALLAFHRHHYRPKNMVVVVVGPQSLDTLESWVIPRFSKIPDHPEFNRGEESSNWSRMKQQSTKLIDQAAKEAPPVSASASNDVLYKPAFRPELQGGKWPIVVTTKPLKSMRKLVLFFPMHPTYDNPDRSPTRILSHLFGHEGRGSSFAILQDLGWVSSLSSGLRVNGPDQNLFQIDMSLTEGGEEHWKEVVEVIFAYAKMLGEAVELSIKSNIGSSNGTCSSGDVLRRIWDEVAQIDRMHFHQTSPGAVYSFASSVAQMITKYGTTKCLSIGSMLEETPDTLPAENLAGYCNQLVPSNCFIERCSEKAWNDVELEYQNEQTSTVTGNFVFGKQTEEWYEIDYYISPVEDGDKKSWEKANNSSLHLPDRNLFIPKSLELCHDLPAEARSQQINKRITPPDLIVNDSSGRLWHRLDDRYALPKSSLTLLLRTPTSEHKQWETNEPDTPVQWVYDSKTASKSNLLTGVFYESMAQDTYDAHVAGLDWSMSKSSSGFTLSCSGYSDRLSDFAIKLLTEFTDSAFVNDSHFKTIKDKAIRGIKSYFQSKRADSLAMYYRNLLVNHRGHGVEKSLEITQAISMDDIIAHHESIWRDSDLKLECLYTGNVSNNNARDFYHNAVDIIKARASEISHTSIFHTTSNRPSISTENDIGPLGRCGNSDWVPGPYERRFPCEDIDLHFQSENDQEENGAVIMTYQSQIASFKGRALSSEESMNRSAAIRLLCAIIKEPFFDELRTKQQLGYIVSSYYDINFASRQPELVNTLSTNYPALATTPVDSIVLYVLSRKEQPAEITHRIDDFLLNFRSRLEAMDPLEIQGYADSLADSLTKPIKKLSEEARYHFTKIRRYAPEVFCNGNNLIDLGWDNPQVMATALKEINRGYLLQVFDELVLKKGTRARIVSTVYGKTFPMPSPQTLGTSSSTILSLDDLFVKRSNLIPFDPATNYQRSSNTLLLRHVWKHKTALQYVAAAAAVIGISAWAVGTKTNLNEKKQIK